MPLQVCEEGSSLFGIHLDQISRLLGLVHTRVPLRAQSRIDEDIVEYFSLCGEKCCEEASV